MNADRERALEALELFKKRVLPSFCRRIAQWKGTPEAMRSELVAEIEQEVALDCLEHAAEIAGLDDRLRNLRWLRLAERFVYRHWTAPTRRRVEQDLDAAAGRDPVPRLVATSAAAATIAEHAQHLSNGRMSLTATGRTLGWSLRQVRAVRRRAANELGLGPEYRAFWCRRLAETLTGLAADRLRDDARVWIASEQQRQRPDPNGRARRLRRVRAMLGRAPLDADTRATLQRWSARGAQWTAEPMELLDDAARLRPRDAGIELWRFEAAAAEGHLRTAAAAIRRARARGADPGSALLARIRLLEMRGHAPAAAALLARARQRWPRDGRLGAPPPPRQLAPYPPPPGVRTIH